MRMFDSTSERWQAVQSRCPAAASAFVYAVLTTQIFCRPTCPARLARRANVRFYDAATAALDAGFRPCKRCKPEQIMGDSVATEAVKKARRCIENRAGNITLAEVAKEVGLSARYLHGLFKNNTGITPSAYASRCRENLKTEPLYTISAPSQWDNSDARNDRCGHDASVSLGDALGGLGALLEYPNGAEDTGENFAVHADNHLEFSSLAEFLEDSTSGIEPDKIASLDDVSAIDPKFSGMEGYEGENGWFGKSFHALPSLSDHSIPSSPSRNSPFTRMYHEGFCEDQPLFNIALESPNLMWDTLEIGEGGGAEMNQNPVEQSVLSRPRAEKFTRIQNSNNTNQLYGPDEYAALFGNSFEKF